MRERFPLSRSITRKEIKAMEKNVNRRREIIEELDGPIDFETAIALLNELEEIDASLSGYPADVEFGSAEWFDQIEEIPFPTSEVDIDGIEGFRMLEAERIKLIYVCAQCEGGLSVIPSWWDGDIWLVECPDDGNIETVGRISKTTVAIRHENAVNLYVPMIKKHLDLWGELYERYRDKLTPVKVRPDEKRQDAILRELGF